MRLLDSIMDGVSSKGANKQKARKRWQILAQVLKHGTYADVSANAVSVRRFQSFGLLSTSPIENSSNDDITRKGQWYQYSSSWMQQLSMRIRHLDNSISAERLNGFNNTGNVCVWPSEEVMAYYCMQHVNTFKDQKICELGGGMTCLAGVALGIFSDADQVEITDGNEESVLNLQNIINANSFGQTKVSTRVVRWGEGATDQDLVGEFDTVICADCLFFDSGREALASLIHDLLKPGGSALLFAPSRGKTFEAFAEIAKDKFEVKMEENYHEQVWKLHTMHKEEDPEGVTYDEALHYPLMMTLKKTISREVTPESR